MRRGAAAFVAFALVATACTHQELHAPRRDAAVVVASFDFPESRLLAAMYAGALRHVGVPVRLERALGPRELVQPALQQGFVDVVPEYVGTALDAVEPGATVDRRDPVAVRAALAAALRRHDVRVLTPSAAQDQNVVVVTAQTAARTGWHTVSDLHSVASRLGIGGPPECPERSYCLLGLRRTYGLRFAQFLPLAGNALVQRALNDGTITVGVMFTTDGALATGAYVALADDRHLQPAENVVPVVSGRVVAAYGPRVTEALDAVSALLTTPALRFLNWRSAIPGNTPEQEAAAWLQRHHLGP